MIVRVWGIVNSTEVEFTPIDGKPDYWEAYAPRADEYQAIEVWAENEMGLRGYLNCSVHVEWGTDTTVRLIVTPYDARAETPAKEHSYQFLQGGNMSMPTALTHVGEKTAIQVMVTNISLTEGFSVVNPIWKLYSNGEIESNGECSVDIVDPFKYIRLTASIIPMRKNAKYKLTIEYQIPPENLAFDMWVLSL